MSRKMMFFTTFSAANWEEYARFTIPTWAKLNNQVVIFWDDSPVPDSLKEFIPENPWARLQFIGNAAINFQKNISAEHANACMRTGKYRYRRDIRKFAWAVYAFAAGVRYCSPGSCAWMDADVAVKKEIPYKAIFPNDECEVTYLGRTVHPVEHPYTESGLIGFRLDAFKALELSSRWEAMLESGQIYTYDQWHDCIVFDEVRKVSPDVNFLSISKDETADHVFDETLSEWLWHYRGPHRKREAWQLEQAT